MNCPQVSAGGRIVQVALVGGLILSHSFFIVWYIDFAMTPSQMLGALAAMVLIVALAVRYAHRLAEVYVAQSGFIVEVRCGWLRQMVQAQADKAGLGFTPRCIIYEDEHINAFVAGGTCAQARLFLSSACLRKLGRQRLAVIIAHELSHIRNGDMVALTTIQAMFALLAWPFWLLWLLVRYLAPVYHDTMLRLALRATYWSSFVLTPVASLTSLLLLRHWEFQADRAASRLIGKQGFVETMRCLYHVQGPAPMRPGRPFSLLALLETLVRSHPSLERRIKAIQGS